MRALGIFTFAVLLTMFGGVFMNAGATENCVKGDCKNGNGTLQVRFDMKYVGAFKNGKFHGNGALHLPDGSIRQGTWKEGLFMGSSDPRPKPDPMIEQTPASVPKPAAKKKKKTDKADKGKKKKKTKGKDSKKEKAKKAVKSKAADSASSVKDLKFVPKETNPNDLKDRLKGL